MFERVRAAMAVLTAPAAPSSSTALATAPAKVPSVRADLIEIKVNGMDAAKQNAMWLTKGADRSQPATAVRLVDCTSDHLKNIVANKPGLSVDYFHIIKSILEDRGEVLPDLNPHSNFSD